MGVSTTFTKQLGAAVSNGIATSQSGSASTPLTLNGSLVSSGIAVLDTFNALTNSAPGRRVVIAYTGTDTSFAIVGTNQSGNTIVDTAVGSGGSAVSNMDFVTVSSITPVGGGLTGVTAGTNGVGASQWWTANWRGYSPISLSAAVELVTGAVNFTLQYTYDDPNLLVAGLLFPTPFSDSVIVNQAVTIDGGIGPAPVKATRILINSGTGEIRCRFVQAGAG